MCVHTHARTFGAKQGLETCHAGAYLYKVHVCAVVSMCKRNGKKHKQLHVRPSIHPSMHACIHAYMHTYMHRLQTYCLIVVEVSLVSCRSGPGPPLGSASEGIGFKGLRFNMGA